jgi:hypothetical protein
VLLYYAVRRLRAFIPFEPVIRVDDKVDAAPVDSPASRHFDVAALIADALLRARLAARYSRPEGLVVKPTIDRHLDIGRRDVAFLVYRSAEWGLETITLRKGAGEAALVLADDDGIVLRIAALADHPDRPVRLSPREAEQANALQRAVEARCGTFVVTDSPTGFVLALHLPRSSGDDGGVYDSGV